MDESGGKTNQSEVNLVDIWNAVQAQGAIIDLINTKLRQELSELKDEVKGSAASVSSQVKRLKTESTYKWKFEGNKLQHSFNSEFSEELEQVVWTIDKCKLDYAREVNFKCT